MSDCALHSRPGRDEGEGAHRIDAILLSAARQLFNGAALDQDGICVAHPDLLPELRRCLHDLTVLFGIQQQEPPPDDDQAGSASRETQLEEELEVLRRSLDEYEVLERVRYGGQGVIYRARRRANGQTVALKLLLDGPLASERQRKRFRREIELALRLRHPNIVPVLGSGVVRWRNYYVMEFVEGVPITDYVLLNDLTPRDIVSLMIKVCRAIEYAHQNGVLHRDLNPANILVDESGAPRVCDFGLAKDLWPRPRSGGSSGQGCGTLPYLSPEQARGNCPIDARSDIYNLGLVLYDLLTDVFPYPVHGKPEAVRQAIIEAEPLPLRRAVASGPADRAPGLEQIDRDLEAVVCRALVKDRSERYQTASELADDLERWLAAQPVRAGPWLRRYLLRKAIRQHRVSLWLVLAFLAGLAVAAISPAIIKAVRGEP